MQPPVALTIAGSDNSAGAGVQADLKTFTAFKVYGLTAITCVVAEVPGKVAAIQPVEPTIVKQQIELSFGAFPIGAVKTGLLHSSAIVEVVCETMAKYRVPLVVDPVMIATSGHRLLDENAVALYQQRLFPMAALVTPNLDEAAALLGHPIPTLEAMNQAVKELFHRYGCPFLLKGGHLRREQAIDLLFAGSEVLEFSAPFVPGVSTHGTGCTYSAAITAGLAGGLLLPEAVGAAKQYLTRAVQKFFRWPRGDARTDALNHFA
ncbi:MAG: bifunctional hydroxymethylpyrimidine kinase/phosphomethylpyrimidine kinase [Chthoniobacteraceae bacterium]